MRAVGQRGADGRAALEEVGRQGRDEAEGLEGAGAEAGEVVDGSFGGDGVGRVRQGAELGEEAGVGGWG